MHSAIRRKQRLSELNAKQTLAALRRLELLSSEWNEVTDVRAATERAERLLIHHPLSSADALQLGAAIVLCSEQPKGWTFITADERLGNSAGMKEFRTVVPG